MMSLLIPWEQIIALGAIEEFSGLKPGFAALAVENVSEPPPSPTPRRSERDPI
jgi:hypothetical protein